MNKPTWASKARAGACVGAALGWIGRAAVRLARDRRGVEAIEFAFIGPVLLMLTLGVLEISIAMFQYHRASEATRTGARVAVIQSPITAVDDLKNTSITCTGAGGAVTCVGAAVTSAASFTAVLAAMQVSLPDLISSNVVVSYAPSTVFADDTTGLVTPLVTVRIVNYTYDLIVLNYVPGVPDTITFPPFATTLLGASFDIPI